MQGTSRRSKKRKIDVAATQEKEYTYEELLGRAMALMDEHRRCASQREWCAHLDEEKPLLMRVGERKTLWVNFAPMCQLIHRNLDHVREFFVHVLGTNAWLDDQGRLLMRGKYVPKYVARIWRGYVQDYVACRCCGMHYSILSRDSIFRRKYIVSCRCCGASFCVKKPQ